MESDVSKQQDKNKKKSEEEILTLKERIKQLQKENEFVNEPMDKAIEPTIETNKMEEN